MGYRATAIVALLALAFAAVACSSSSGTASILPAGEGGVYLALGDSIAEGENASDPERTEYVALVFDALQAHYGDSLRLESLAVGGHTTQDLIDMQLPGAIERLRGGDVLLVTVTIGGLDLNQYGANTACIDDPADPACPVAEGLVAVRERLETILGELREAGPDVTIVVQAYPNLFSGTGNMFEHQAETAFGMLNEEIIDVAGEYDAGIADPRVAFAGRGGELTHLLDASPDAHPNDAGYRIIADAFLEALGVSSTDGRTD